jgi:MinD-like ATPase involved in chromosome partitioning or flagellar assembly
LINGLKTELAGVRYPRHAVPWHCLQQWSFVMAQNEKTSQRVAQIAAKALQNPSSITQDEIQTLAASALTQSPDQQQRQKAQQILDKLQK